MAKGKGPNLKKPPPKQQPKGTPPKGDGSNKVKPAPAFDKEAFKARLATEVANTRNELRLELHVQYRMLVENGAGVGDFETWLKEYSDQYIHTQQIINANPIKVDKDYAPLLKKISKEYKDK